MAVLLALAERQGTVVPQDVLLALVWGGTFVAPGALTRAVSLVRSALGDDPHDPRYIETVPKRGYKLIACVEDITESPRSTPGATPAPRPRLPWGSLEVAALVVILIVAALSGGGRPPSATRTKHVLRAMHHTREGNENAFAHYTRAVALDPSSADSHAGLSAAYAFRANYLPDRARWIALAIESGTRATQADPRSPNAAKALGAAYAWAGQYQLAARQYRRTLELRPDDSDARIGLGHVLLSSGRVTEALGLFEQEITVSPHRSEGYAHLANGLTVAGHGASAVEVARAAVALEPYARTAQLALVRDDLLGARYEAARLRLERLLEVSPECAQCVVQLGLIEQLGGHRERAAARYRAARAIMPPFPPASLRLAQLEAAAGRRAEAETLLAEVERAARSEITARSERYYPRWQLAIVAALRGDRGSAMDWYAQAVATGRRDLVWDEWDPLLAEIRRHDGCRSLHEPFRAEHVAAASIAGRLAQTLAAVGRMRPFGPLTAIPDPPGWPSGR
jgi:tetratricopeptide (TPR) repeat protein